MKSTFAAMQRPVSMVLCAVGFLTSTGAPLHAQTPQLVQSIPDANSPVERLGRYIRILSGSPRDLDALLGAGQAALDVGDANAALGFFARAEDVAPANGRVKSGLGSSLVMIERPDDALRLYAEAAALGIPEVAIARDRGLAYDLRGDPKRAQRDYAVALTRGSDDELVRRYALSLGISGDRAGAMAMLDPLLRKQDQGAWRARAFIMAMNGDVSGAQGVARQLMVPAMADAMAPLLSRLASLNAAERAHAVNFGTIPADGTQLAVRTGDPFLGTVPPRTGLVSAEGIAVAPVASNDGGLIPSGKPLGPRTVEIKSARVVMAESPEPRRRPGADAAAATPAPGFTAETTSRLGQRIGTRVGPVDPRTLPPEARGEGTRIAQVQTGALPPPDAAQPVYEVPAQPVPTTPATRPPASRLAGLLAGIEREPETIVELPNTAELRRARAAARKKMAELAAQAAADEAAKREKAEQAAAAKRHPARVWVQVAAGRNDSGIGITFRRIKSANETALKGLSGWFAPSRVTNRILVGPMKSAASARKLIGKLAKNGVSAMIFNSDAGEEVEKIPGK